MGADGIYDLDSWLGRVVSMTNKHVFDSDPKQFFMLTFGVISCMVCQMPVQTCV